MKKLTFYDVKAKKKFNATKYKLKTKGGRKFAVTEAPSGVESWRVVPKNFKG